MNLSEEITLTKTSYGPHVKLTLRYEDNEKVDDINLNEDRYISIFVLNYLYLVLFLLYIF